MESFNFFLKGIQANRFLEVDWMLSVLTLSEYPFSDEAIEFKPYDIAKDRATGKRVFFDPELDHAFTPIEGIADLAPVIEYKKTYAVKAGDLPNIAMGMQTTGGTFVANLFCLVLPFKDKIPYINKKLRPGDINTPVAKLLNTDVITIDEYLYFCECVSFLGNFWGVSVPTGSAKTMTVSPAVVALKEKLLKEHASELHDSVVMAGIETKLCEADALEFKGDVAEDFFMSKKSRSINRKKTKIIYGLDDGLGGGQPALVTRALNEGLQVQDIPAAADSTRAASYSRGFLTAQGGELVNYLYRIFMNTKITVDDCKTKAGIPAKITDINMKRYVNRFMFDGTGSTTVITTDTIKNFVGKTIVVRSPGRCKEKAPNFCGSCTDSFFFKARETVHIETSLPGSIIVNDRMKAMHGRDYKIAFFDPVVYLT